MAEGIYQIFDKVFKKVLTLSSKAVINLINGLFETDYPLDSTIIYNWTEFEDDNLKKILADTILTINGKNSYHLEAQMENDNSIVFRVFEYGFGHANRTRESDSGKYILRFPRPIVVYLYYESTVPDEYILNVGFNEGADVVEYKVPVLKLPEISSRELCNRKMVILIPFHILKLRYAIEKGKFDDLDELQRYILNDIIGHINENLKLGNITTEDALKLKGYLQKLCDYLCAHYEELEVIKDMTDESFMTDIDIMCKEHEDAMAAKQAYILECVQKMAEQDAEIAEKDEQIAEKDELIAEKDEQIAEKDEQIAEKDEQLAKKDEEIKTLMNQLKELKK